MVFRRGYDSEYPAVVIPVAMLQRNLLYVCVTRGKRLVVLVGHKKAVAIAVRNVSGRRRWSKLGEWLASGNHSTPRQSSKPWIYARFWDAAEARSHSASAKSVENDPERHFFMRLCRTEDRRVRR